MALPLLLTGCGPNAPWSGSSGDQAKYDSCLREHGMKVTKDGDATKVEGPNPETGKAARSACKQYAPVRDAPSSEDRKRMMDQGIKFAACMRQHGVDVPDPVQDADGGIELKMPEDKGSPTLQAAERACKSLMGPPR